MEIIVKNESNTDRVIRGILGVGLIVATFFVGSPFGYLTGVAAAIMLGTAAIGMCPLYRIFGLKTCQDC